MAFEESNGGSMYMPVAPAYGAGNGMGFGGDWSWLIIVLLLCGGGWGFGGFGGMGGMMGLGMMDGFGLYPWLNNSQHISDGFRDQQLSTQLGGIQNAVTSGFGDVQTALCGGFAGVNATVNGAQNAISQQLYTNEIANLNRSFAEQTANTAGFASVNSGIADLRYTEATEACATRTASATNTRDIIDSQTRGTQAILDKLCALELDGVKGQLAQAQRENAALQTQLTNARFDASQAAQTAAFQLGMNNEVDALYNRLSNCPVPSVPVYGRQPIFQCNQQPYGCGCGNGFAN